MQLCGNQSRISILRGILSEQKYDNFLKLFRGFHFLDEITAKNKSGFPGLRGSVYFNHFRYQQARERRNT